MAFPFNVRVYGALVYKGCILISSEEYQGISFTKLPGGGLQFGEGLKDALKREFIEELNLEVQILGHIYTTDFFQPSAFNKSHQVISVYYQVGLGEEAFLGLKAMPAVQSATGLDMPQLISQEQAHRFEWVHLAELDPTHFTFPIDKYIVPKLKELRSVEQ